MHAFKGSCIVIFLAAPSRISGVTLTKTVESQAPALRVTWTTPQSDLTISQYQVEYRRSGTTPWDNATAISISPPATSTILTGLDAGTEYTVRVRAVSEIGNGTWSVEHTGRTFCSEFNAPSTSDKISFHTYSTYMYVYGPNIVSLLSPAVVMLCYIHNVLLLQEIYTLQFYIFYSTVHISYDYVTRVLLYISTLHYRYAFKHYFPTCNFVIVN